MSNEKARIIGTIDSETNPFDGQSYIEPFVWGLYIDGEFLTFFDTQEVINFISRKRWILYAHNGGKFDFHFLSKWIAPYSTPKIINGRIAEMMIGECILRDSFCIIPNSLKNYGKLKFDYDKLKPENRAQFMDEIINYLRVDCQELHRLVNISLSTYGNKLTLASQAINFWQQMSGIKKEEYTTDNTDYDATFRQYYFGGRVQCFRTGEINEHIESYDIKSAYPFAMLHDVPFGFSYGCGGEIKPQSFITIECESKGAFPIRIEHATEFPNDKERRVFNITGWEYLEAEKFNLLGKNPKILSVKNHDRTINFSDYVNHFYQMKLSAETNGDNDSRNFAKLFMNSLYGKFGMDADNYLSYFIAPSQYAVDLKMRAGEQSIILNFVCEIGNGMAIYSYDGNADGNRFLNVAVSASITGFVRAYLLKYLMLSEGLIYCDTDSIKCKKFPQINIGKELGQWEFEGSFNRGAVGGKKLYIFEDTEKGTVKTACKGARLTNEELWSVCGKGQTVEYRSLAPSFSACSVGSQTYLTRKIRSTASNSTIG